MPTAVYPGGYLDQKRWSPTVTLFTESQTVVAHLIGEDDNAVIHADMKQIEADVRGSQTEFKYGDRFRGAQLGPKALGTTKFGSETGQRPLYKQTLNLLPQELATAGFFALWSGQQYTDVPIERHDLRAAGAEAAEIYSRSMYYHLAGITAYNTPAYNSNWSSPPMGNLVRELDASHRFYCNNNTSDAGVAADGGANLTMEFLESIATKLSSRAYVQSPGAIPSTPWGDFIIFITDPEGNQQLQTHSTSNRYMSLTLSELNGGASIDKVAAFMKLNQGFVGTKQILVLVDDLTPFGQTGSTADDTTAGTQIGGVRRGMLLFRRAMEVQWGQGFTADTSHVMASYFQEHEWESWKLFTHWGGISTRPDAAVGSGQRFGSATVSYHVGAGTPIY